MVTCLFRHQDRAIKCFVVLPHKLVAQIYLGRRTCCPSRAEEGLKDWANNRYTLYKSLTVNIGSNFLTLDILDFDNKTSKIISQPCQSWQIERYELKIVYVKVCYTIIFVSRNFSWHKAADNLQTGLVLNFVRHCMTVVLCKCPFKERPQNSTPRKMSLF
jgi:hypothetical protein